MAAFGLLGDVRFAEQATKVRGLSALADLDPAETVDFLFRLGLERMGNRAKIFSVENPGEVADKAHIALNRALEALEPWPDAFFGVLADMRSRWGTTATASMRLCAGAVERWLDGLPEGHGQVIRNAVSEYRAREPARLRQAFEFDGKPAVRRTRSRVAGRG